MLSLYLQFFIILIILLILGDKEGRSYEVVLVDILDSQVQKLRNKKVVFVNVLWRNPLVKVST